jgi:ABC-type transport system substrate-binding protein
VLRYAFRIAETAFDPPQITDLYSRTVVANIYESPLEFAWMARPAKLRPATLEAMPEVSADFKTITLRVKPGIYFADDPAFKGRKRELVAADYVYSIKRHYDPQWKSGNLYILENAKILGLSELRKQLIDAKKPFDYDREVDGLRALDRYTWQIRFAEPQPRFLYQLVPTRSARGPSGSRCGCVRRRWCWSATPATARSITTKSRRPSGPTCKPWQRLSRAGGCPSSTASRSRSSKRTSRAGWPS